LHPTLEKKPLKAFAIDLASVNLQPLSFITSGTLV
jgi:hypothetical protein